MTVYALDIETWGKTKDEAVHHKRNTLVGMGWYSSEGDQGFLTDPEDIRDFFQKLPSDVTCVWHNGKFDQKTLAEKVGVWPRNDFDTMRGAALLPQRPPNLALDSLVYKFFGEPSWKEDDVRGSIDVERVKPYCIRDCKETLRLYGYELDHLQRVGQLGFFRDFYMPLTDLLARAEFRGVEMDQVEFRRQWDTCLAELGAWETHLTAKYADLVQPYVEQVIAEWQAGLKKPPTQEAVAKKRAKEAFNWRSNQQVIWVLQKLWFPCRKWDQKKKKEVESADWDVLVGYKGQHEVIDDLLRHRELAKLEGYFPQWQEATVGTRLYTHFNEEGAKRTGRLSSSGPNLQQIPKGECRRLIVAPEGRSLYVVDLSQIEPRILANRAKDAVLMRAVSGEDDLYAVLIKEAKGLKETPAEVYKNRKAERDQGKVLLLSKMYGAGAFNIAKQLGISPQEASDLIDRLNAVIPGVQNYTKELIEQVEQEGCIETLLGRKLWISREELFSKKKHINVLNYDTQGSASDLNCYAHLLIDRWVRKTKFPAHLVLLVHDEAVYEIDQGCEKEFDDMVMYAITELVPTKLKIKVPIKGTSTWGQNWAIKT